MFGFLKLLRLRWSIVLLGQRISTRKVIRIAQHLGEYSIRNPSRRSEHTAYSRASEELLEMLRVGNDSVRAAAVQSLGRIGCKAAIPKLLLLVQAKSEIAQDAARALVMLGWNPHDPEMRSLVVSYMITEVVHDGRYASLALDILKWFKHEPILATLLKEWIEWHSGSLSFFKKWREFLPHLVAIFGPTAVLTTYLESIEESIEDIEGYARSPLAECSDLFADVDRRLIVGAIQRGRRPLDALELMERLGDPSVVPILLSCAIESPNRTVDLSPTKAIEKLEAFNHPSAVTALVRALEGPNEESRKAAVLSLWKLGWRAPDPRRRVLHAIALGRWKDATTEGPVSGAILLDLLIDKKLAINSIPEDHLPLVLTLVLKSATDLGDIRAIAPLVQLFELERKLTKHQIDALVDAVVSFGDKAYEHLLDAHMYNFRDQYYAPGTAYRLPVVKALAEIGGPEVVPILLKVYDRYPEIVEPWLIRLGHEEISCYLVDRLYRGAGDCTKRIIAAIGGSRTADALLALLSKPGKHCGGVAETLTSLLGCGAARLEEAQLLEIAGLPDSMEYSWTDTYINYNYISPDEVVSTPRKESLDCRSLKRLASLELQRRGLSDTPS